MRWADVTPRGARSICLTHTTYMQARCTPKSLAEIPLKLSASPGPSFCAAAWCLQPLASALSRMWQEAGLHLAVLLVPSSLPPCTAPTTHALCPAVISLGAVVATFSVDLAIEKARTAGIALVSARRSNHFGIAGYYSLRAMESGMICLAGFFCLDLFYFSVLAPSPRGFSP